MKNRALVGRKFTGGARASPFIRQWAWKREMKTDEERFRDDYVYDRDDDEDDANPKATIRLRQRQIQRRRRAGSRPRCGTARSCCRNIWKSEIETIETPRRRDALELGAGCGLCACVLAKRCENLVTGTVYATDVAENVDLLTENVEGVFVANRGARVRLARRAAEVDRRVSRRSHRRRRIWCTTTTPCPRW